MSNVYVQERYHRIVRDNKNDEELRWNDTIFSQLIVTMNYIGVNAECIVNAKYDDPSFQMLLMKSGASADYNWTIIPNFVRTYKAYINECLMAVKSEQMRCARLRLPLSSPNFLSPKRYREKIVQHGIMRAIFSGHHENIKTGLVYETIEPYKFRKSDILLILHEMGFSDNEAEDVYYESIYSKGWCLRILFTAYYYTEQVPLTLNIGQARFIGNNWTVPEEFYKMYGSRDAMFRDEAMRIENFRALYGLQYMPLQRQNSKESEDSGAPKDEEDLSGDVGEYQMSGITMYAGRSIVGRSYREPPHPEKDNDNQLPVMNAFSEISFRNTSLEHESVTENPYEASDSFFGSDESMNASNQNLYSESIHEDDKNHSDISADSSFTNQLSDDHTKPRQEKADGNRSNAPDPLAGTHEYMNEFVQNLLTDNATDEQWTLSDASTASVSTSETGEDAEVSNLENGKERPMTACGLADENSYKSKLLKPSHPSLEDEETRMFSDDRTTHSEKSSPRTTENEVSTVRAFSITRSRTSSNQQKNVDTLHSEEKGGQGLSIESMNVGETSKESDEDDSFAETASMNGRLAYTKSLSPGSVEPGKVDENESNMPSTSSGSVSNWRPTYIQQRFNGGKASDQRKATSNLAYTQKFRPGMRSENRERFLHKHYSQENGNMNHGCQQIDDNSPYAGLRSSYAHHFHSQMMSDGRSTPINSYCRNSGSMNPLPPYQQMNSYQWPVGSDQMQPSSFPQSPCSNINGGISYWHKEHTEEEITQGTTRCHQFLVDIGMFLKKISDDILKPTLPNYSAIPNAMKDSIKMAQDAIVNSPENRKKIIIFCAVHVAGLMVSLNQQCGYPYEIYYKFDLEWLTKESEHILRNYK